MFDFARTTFMAAIVLVSPCVASAQDTSAASPGLPAADADQASPAETATADSQDIIVTANKREESSNRVPVSITAVTGDTLTSLGIRDTSDLTRVVPGFVAVANQLGTPVFFLRAVGFYNFSLAGKSTVTVYNDEAPLPYSVMAAGTNLDIERVEVLKGPQGTLFGSNSTGGAINFIAAKPTDHFAAGLDGSYGRFNNTVLSGFVSGPLSDDITARIALSHEGRGDWQKSYTSNQTLGSLDVTSGRITIATRPGQGRLALRLTLSGTIDKSDTQAVQLVGKVNPRPDLAAYPLAPANDRAADFNTTLVLGKSPKRDNAQGQAVLRADYEATDSVSLTSLTSYVYSRQRFGVDGDGTTLHTGNYYSDGHVASFSQELRASGQFGATSQWVIGGNIERDSSAELNYVDTSDSRAGHTFDALGLPPINVSLNDARIKDRFWAVFGNVDFDPARAITLHAGARYTGSKSLFAGCVRNVGNQTSWIGLATSLRLPVALVGLGDCQTLSLVNGVPTPGLVNSTLTKNNLSWRLGVDWKPTDRTLVYASASRGFKAGQYANIAATFSDQYAPVTQEELTAYEAGVKTSLFSRILQFNAALFYYDYKNKQLQGRKQVPIFGFQQALVNIPKSRVYGGEVAVTLRPATGVTLSGAATYVSTKILGSYTGFDAFGTSRNLGGYGFPNTPHWQANADAEYRWPVHGNLDAFVGANTTYRSQSDGDFVPDPRLDIDAYALIDVRAGIEASDKTWSAQIWGRNITDRYYWTNSLKVQERLFRFAGMPVTYGASLSYRF